MTDDQFDEICRDALAFEPGRASERAWSRVQPTRWSWLPTVPEILACGCACGLVLFVVGVQFGHRPHLSDESNPVVQRAMGGSLAGLQASTFQVPDTTSWTETAVTLPAINGAFMGRY
jgi:hypothetical protein